MLAFPDGLPTLKGASLLRAQQANAVFQNIVHIVNTLAEKGTTFSVENPARS